LIAPHLYLLSIHPEREPFWQSNQNRLDDLAQVLYQAGREAGFYFLSHPILQVTPDPEIALPDIRITSMPDQSSSTGHTSSLPAHSLLSIHQPSGPAFPPNAYLIVNGVENFPLNLPVINIGRRPDNHLVINDPRVSRSHAQIRAIRGRFVVFDLNSSGGTYVNSQAITQQALSPGDVISLAGVSLIFGQDQPIDLSETTAMVPSQPPRPDGQPPIRPAKT
jgi:hypothetical protein